MVHFRSPFRDHIRTELLQRRISVPLLAFLGLFLAAPSYAQELVNMAPDPDAEYSPYLQEDYPNQVFFGDTHLHTAYSADAGLVGATTTPDDAYRFAKGETVTSSNGIRARLSRPLDFLVVADHAENMGLTIALGEDSPIFGANEWGRGLVETYDGGAPKERQKPTSIGARPLRFLMMAIHWRAPGSTAPCGSA